MKKLFKIAAIAAVAAFPALSTAADFPDRTLTFVVPYPPGGPTDITGRLLAEALGKELGQTVVVENRGGASGSIGISYVIRSKPDGYTFGAVAAPSLVAPFMLDSKPYDLTTDVQTVGMAYVTPLVVLVNPEKIPEVTDMASLVEYVKGQSGGFNYTTAGIGSTAHLAMEIIDSENDLDMLHIPYQGSAPAINALLAGDVDMMYSDLVAAMPQITSGKLKAIAINTDERLDDLPDVPTLVEQGVEAAKAVSWGGLVLPKDAPEEAVDVLSAALESVLQDEGLQDQMRRVGAIAQYQDPAELAQTIKVDSEIWDNAIKEFNIKDEF